MAIMVGLAVLFGIMSAILLCGKGAFLISGYNTSSKEEKAKYDEKKLCRVTGTGMALCTIAFIIGTIFGVDNVWVIRVIMIIIFGAVIGIIACSNSCCYSAEYKANPEHFKENGKSNSTWTKVCVGLVVVIMIVVVIMLETGRVTVEFNDTAMTVVASFWPDESIQYDTITSVTYREDLNVGDRNNGLASFKLNLGSFENSEFGDYTLYTNVNCYAYVVMETTEGIVVINGKNVDETKAIYDALREKLDD